MMWRCMRTAAVAASLLVLGPAAQAASDTPVKIGVLGDQSSVYSAAGGRGSVEAAKLAAEDAGLVLGNPVEIVSADFQLKVDIGVAIARKWYDEENVDAVDLIGTLMAKLSSYLGTQPKGVPGLLHTIGDEYFRRIEAVEFTVRNDDGREPRNLPKADLVLVGIFEEAGARGQVDGDEAGASLSENGASWLPAAQQSDAPFLVSDVSWGPNTSVFDELTAPDGPEALPYADEPERALEQISNQWVSPPVIGVDKGLML